MTFKRLLPALAIAAALGATGCGDSKDEKEAGAPTSAPSAAATERPAPAEPVTEDTLADVSKDLKSEPQITKPDGTPPAELIAKDIVVGKGPKAKPGDTLSMQYTGVAFSTGTKFDASWDRGAEPFTFKVGAGNVIPGWDQGIPGMRVGGRRELVIPAELAYGAQSPSPDIGPNETLIFVVDLEKIG
jgi:peptidylprolyl isomerase